MLVALNAISAKQASATSTAPKSVSHFLDYAVTNLNAKNHYHASGMRLHIDSDASYLLVRQVRSRVGGHFIHSKATAKISKHPDHPTINGTLHT